MCCSHLLMLQELLNDNQISQLDNFFAGLIGSATENVTVSKVARLLDISPGVASRVLIKCKEKGLLDVAYAIRCPGCQMLIGRVNSLKDIPEEIFECYCCNEDIEITSDDIEVIYKLRDESVFNDGQSKELQGIARTVAQDDTISRVFLAEGVNEFFFHPKDEEYEELQRLYSCVMNTEGTTKEVGDTLEVLVEYLFSLCSVFRVAGIRTQTNQIDCCVRNKMFLPYGVLKIIGQYFFIECKNENKTPSGSYFSKLHSIISLTNASGKGQGAMFGIIISKKKVPRTFKQLAVKTYLSDGIIVVSICAEELKTLFDKRGNLLDLIERKAIEIMTDSKTDFIDAGLFEC